MEISTQWTDEERLTAIAEISSLMHEAMQENRVFTASRAWFFMERVELLATAHSTFLEANRAQILEGTQYRSEA